MNTYKTYGIIRYDLKGSDNLKISTKGRYALRLMLDLAQNRNEGFVALKDIADRQDISKKYLEQIVPILNRAGLLKTTRGYQGGYMLAKSPSSYTVGDILRITEGSLAPVACLEDEVNQCDIYETCMTAAFGKGFTKSLTNTLIQSLFKIF